MLNHAKNLIKKVIQTGHQTTTLLDKRLLKKTIECKWPPVFILGPPRSGTTLLYQLMASSFRFAYFSNLTNRYFMCPITATQIGIQICHEYKTDFASEYGFEKGCMALSEAGNIWNRWFPQEKRDGFNYTPSGYLSKKTQESIYKIIANIEDSFDAPFMTKNGKSCVRIPTLLDIFPNALFIEIERNLMDSALSILLRLKKYNLDWWSVMPKQIDQFRNANNLEKVCKQVYFIKKNITEDLQSCQPQRFYSLQYDTLCENPAKKMDEIYQFLESNGCFVKRKQFMIPQDFQKSTPKVDGWVSRAEIVNMEKMISNLIQKEQPF